MNLSVCHLAISCVSTGSRLLTLLLYLGDVEAASPRNLGSRGLRGSYGVPAVCSGNGAVVCLQPTVCILEIGEFALLMVELDLVPLSSGQIRRVSDPFLSE